MDNPVVAEQHVVLLLFDRGDGIFLVEMPRHVTITFKNSKASLRDMAATFSDTEWDRLRSDWVCVTEDKDEPSKRAYKCVVDGKGSEEVEILLDLRDIMAIV